MVHAAKALQALSGAWAATLLPYDFRRLDDPLAVCNDGSKAGYYFRRGQRGGHTWLIYLAGGNWCFDKTSCMERCPPVQKDFMGDAFCSSRKYPKTVQFGGILAPSNPNSTLGLAHKAYVMYCSSDGHMGDGEAWGMQFRGRRIVEAVFRDLVKRDWLAREAPGKKLQKELVILGGVSAGARGAMVHLEYVPQFLAKAGGQSEVQVMGFLDSPLWVDIPPMLQSGFKGFRKSCRNVRKFANVTNLGEECSRAFPEQQRFKCIMGQYRMQYIKTPYMLVAAQYDSFQLMYNVGEPKDAVSEMKYLADFGKRTLSLVEALGASGGQQPRAYFSPSCFSHARSAIPEGFSEEGADAGNGQITTMESALEVFILYAMSRSSGPALSFIDRCQGVACGRGCPKPWSGAAGLGKRMLPLLAFLIALTTLSTSIL